MKIVSLVPSATEMLFALGLDDSVVAVTHECDFPQKARELPYVTKSVLPAGLSTAEIDQAVKERTRRGEPLYELDEDLLAKLKPDLVVTQAVCAVCAVSVDDVRGVADRLDPAPSVLSLDPTTLGEVLADMSTLAHATGADDAGKALTQALADRIDQVTELVQTASRPRTASLEWLDPPFVAGHWVPQMIDLAGAYDVLGMVGENSRTATWQEIRQAQPEVIVSMPCGMDLDACATETRAHGDAVRALSAKRVFAVDAAAYFSRPGPRLVDGIEILAGLFHPDRTETPPRGCATLLEGL